MKIILLVLLTVSVTLADFTRSNEIVSDSATNLEWQDDVTPAVMTFQVAIDYCEALTLGSNSDWRLPNINELTSLVDDTRYNPAINPTFTNTVLSYYWSSTTYLAITSNAWRINFTEGFHHVGTTKADYSYVRCVRGVQ